METTEMNTAKEIRQKFLDFFESKGHTVVPSAPMVVKNDPTLMFTNAGMNQFKDIFLGNTTPKSKRATDSQKCLRVSGKHNDLEAVGHDGRHHTMFEMLGNWSFGDYFKEEAISWAWELLTEVYKIDKTKLYATVFEGSAEDGTQMDSEALEAWKKHLPEDHIIMGNKHDNFWEMGDTGPCGPSSEIHIDLRSDEEIAKVPGRDMVNTDNDQVIEIWNLVFMQFNRKADGSLEPLPAKNIDTGMGFERLCMVLQGKTSNYDTDVFSGMIKQIEKLSGHSYHENAKTEVAMRVIADHIRAIAFSIADGQLPSNVKAGYVIRRILRRAVRYGYTFLGFEEPFLCSLVPQLIDDMGEAYPELGKQQKLIESVIREEEMSFLRTLDRGIRMMDDYMAKNADTKTIPGVDAFILYDTYGFPVDLTGLIASENGYTVDMDGFAVELQKQKERARSATANEFGDWTVFVDGEEEAFLGYDCLEIEGARLLKHRTVKQKNKTMIQLVFDRTPFYAEMGGQVGDTGVIIAADGEQIRILNTVKENNLTIHIAEKVPVLRCVCAVHFIVRTHNCLCFTLFYGSFEGGKVYLLKSPLIYDTVRGHSESLLGVCGKMLAARCDAVCLYPANQRSAHLPREMRIFRIIFEIPSAERISLYVDPGTEDHRDPFGSGLFSEELSHLLVELLIPGGSHGRSRGEAGSRD